MEKAFLEKTAKESKSMAQFIRKIGRKPSGGNYLVYRKKLSDFSISTSHWSSRNPNSDEGLRKGAAKKRIPLEKILVENSDYFHTSNLKKRLLDEGLLEYRCYIDDCPTKNMKDWCGKPILFELDHINGKRKDNRLKNLRLLCSICHAQTPTYCGKNQKRKPIKTCLKCTKPIHRRSKLCRSCNQLGKFKIAWPEINSLVEEIKKTSVNAVSKKLGVAFNSLKKHLKRNNMYHLC